MNFLGLLKYDWIKHNVCSLNLQYLFKYMNENQSFRNIIESGKNSFKSLGVVEKIITLKNLVIT